MWAVSKCMIYIVDHHDLEKQENFVEHLKAPSGPSKAELLQDTRSSRCSWRLIISWWPLAPVTAFATPRVVKIVKWTPKTRFKREKIARRSWLSSQVFQGIGLLVFGIWSHTVSYPLCYDRLLFEILTIGLLYNLNNLCSPTRIVDIYIFF